jgi:hypothetical protein
LFDKSAAFISSIGFASAVPVLEYGGAVLTDGAAYAVLAFLFYLVLYVLDTNDLKTSVVGGVLIGIGMLTKETSIIIVIFLAIRLILEPKQRIHVKYVVLTVVISLAVAFAWSQLIGYGGSFIQYLGEGFAYKTAGYKGPFVHPRLFVLTIVYAFDFLLAFALIGLLRIDDAPFRVVWEILLASAILIIAWPTAPEWRFTFLAFPAILPIAGVGVLELARNVSSRPWFRVLSERQWITLILLVIILYNNLLTFHMYFRLPWMS